MRSEKILSAIGGIGEDLIEDAEITSNKNSRQSIWWKIVAVAACICLVIAVFPLLGNQEQGVNLNPLVISVYAQDADGKIVPTALKLGEKVKMYPQASTIWDDFEGYAINLTLLDVKYVSTWAVDENWETIRYPGDSSQYNFDEDCNWAVTEGDDVWWIYFDQNGKIIQPGVDDLLAPKLRGSEVLWRPNKKGHNRSVIAAFDDNYKLVTVYFLEITEYNNEYYAEIVKVDNKIPESLY